MAFFDWRGRSSDPGRRTHVLIVGISDYDGLPDPGGDASATWWNARKLTAAAKTAYRVFEWLDKFGASLEAPVATCELLLAPVASELAAMPQLADYVSRCGVNEFVDAANAWRARASESTSDCAVFYFCGLGKELSPSEPIICLQDCARGVGPRLRGTVSVNNLRYGLSPHAGQRDVARTQLFFIDSSRSRLPALSAGEARNTTAAFDALTVGLDDRNEVVVFGARPGAAAYSMVNHASLLSEALLACLGGAAAVPCPSEDGALAWQVTLNSLARGLPAALADLNERYEFVGPAKSGEVARAPLAPEFEVFGGTAQDATIVRLPVPPAAELDLVVRARGDEGAPPPPCLAWVDDERGEPVADRRGFSGAHKIRLPAGFYNVHVLPQPAGPGGGAPGAVTARAESRLVLLRPPRTTLVITLPPDVTAHH